MATRIMQTTQGHRVETDLTDEQAAQAAGRIPNNHPDRGFARSLVTRYHERGFLSDRQLPYLHRLAIQQIGREGTTQAAEPTPAARPVTATAPPANTQRQQEEIDRRELEPGAGTQEEFGAGLELPPMPVPAFTQEQRDWAASLEPHMFFYDIPSASGMANPSGQLWRIGARINLSCWVIPKANIPYGLMSRIIEEGGRVHTIPFAKEAAEKLLDLIHSAITEEATEALKRTEESMDKTADGDKKVKAKDAAISAAGKRVEKLLGDLRASARVFGLSLSGLPIANVLAQAQVLQARAYKKARAITNAVQKAKATNVGEVLESDEAALARAVQQDQCHPGILADYIDDHGGDSSELREAFAEVE